jgi:ribosomal protein L16 Arg81 hydroxylase
MPRSSFFIDAEWKRWIAENTLLGAPVDDLVRILIENGFDASHSKLEVEACKNHPYIIAATALSKKMKKTDWVLHTSRMLREAHSPEIAEYSDSIDTDLFFKQFYALNKPLIVRNAVKHWPAVKQWNAEYLIEKAGACDVQIQSRRTQNLNYEIQASQHRQVTRFDDFVKQVFFGVESNDIYMTAQNGDINGNALANLWPDLAPLPAILNDATDVHRMFFWIGPRGTVTPLHHDLTNNLMAQVVGRKLVKLIAPDYLPYIYNHYHCYSQVDPENVDLAKFPLFKRVKVFDVEIGPGDLLFLPVGWWHHVRSLDPSITITATNFRGINQFNEHYPN